MYGKKRYRADSPGAAPTAFSRKVRRVLATQDGNAAVPGVTRTGGYYGRYRSSARPSGTGELKFFDSTDSITVPTSGDVNTSLNLIPQGVTESTRIGRKCTLKSIMLRGMVRLPNTSDPTKTADQVRVIVYQDKQANGATAAVTDILESAHINSFRNLANSGRFRVLMEREVTVNCQAGAYDGTNDQFGQVEKDFKAMIKCNVPLEFDSTTGAITEIRSNNVGVLAVSQNGAALLSYYARVRYAD